MQPANKGISIWIEWITGSYLFVGLAVWVTWIMSGDERGLRLFFDYAAASFFVGMACFELCLTVVCYRQFSVGEPLRRAWLLIAASSACRVTGMAVAHILGVKSYLNPFYWQKSLTLDDSVASFFRPLGLVVSGPMHMALLAIGLFQVLKIYRGVGLAVRLRNIDRLLLALVLGFTAWQGCEIALSKPFSGSFSAYTLINWMTDPLLCVLLWQAILIQRYVSSMGKGFVPRCWGAFTKAIFATSLGSMGMWASAYQHIPYPLNSISWYIWFLVSALFTLGPAYQLEAIQRASLHVQLKPFETETKHKLRFIES